MKGLSAFRPLKVLASLAVFAAVSAGAQLQVDEPPSPGGGAQTTYTVEGSVFTFTAIGDFPPCFVGTLEITECQFLNASGVTWNTVTLRIAPGSEPVGCAALFGYDTCVAQQGTDDLPSLLTFSGGTGIRPNQILAFKGSGWTSDTTFVVAANIPEPGSVTLMVLGIGGLAISRRWLKLSR